MTDVRFIRAKNRKGAVITVAYQYHDDEEAIHYATARQSKRDVHVKKIGRDVSFGRLVSSGGKKITYTAIGSDRYSAIAEFVTKNIEIL